MSAAGLVRARPSGSRPLTVARSPLVTASKDGRQQGEGAGGRRRVSPPSRPGSPLRGRGRLPRESVLAVGGRSVTRCSRLACLQRAAPTT